MLVDSHCHLDFPELAGDIDGVMARAADAGVGTMLTICTHITKFPGVLAVAERYDQVWCTVGIHPHEAGREPETSAERLSELANHPKVVGFGETGLDYHYMHSRKEVQQRSFRAHIGAARATGLPLIVHTREAEADTARILAEEHDAGAFPGLIHCFSSSAKFAEKAIKLGLAISFSGIVTFKKAEALREVAATVPGDRILVETDAPYLAPVPKRGKRNEPAFVAYTAAEVAAVRGVSITDLAAQTSRNFFNLFTKITPPRYLSDV